MAFKYEFVAQKRIGGTVVHQIKALINIPTRVRAGTIGGWIESEQNCPNSSSDSSWVANNAIVMGKVRLVNSLVENNAVVDKNASITNSTVSGNATVTDNATVVKAIIKDHCKLVDNCTVQNTHLYGKVFVKGNAQLVGKTTIAVSSRTGIVFGQNTVITAGNIET